VVAIDRITQKEASATHVADVAHCDLMPQCAQEQGDYCRKGREEEKRR
jgi:ketopantoate hydroxymethyltransferase